MPEHFESDVDERQPPLRAAQRGGLRRPRRGHATSTSTGRRASGSTPTPTRSPPSRPAPACSCTCRSAPQDFAAHWNAAQALAGPQLALGANSPFFFGKQLWAETRIELFLQATDTRSVELKNQGVRPRVFFGERWITSIFDLFEENVRYFPALLPEVTDEDPEAVLDAGEAPRLQELRLHNGTVYRWNRPDLRHRRRPPAPAGREPRAAGRPDHRRRPGQRGLLLRRHAHAGRRGPAGLDEDELRRGGGTTSTTAPARGIDARVYWPGFGEVAGRRAGAAPPAAAGPRGAGSSGASPRRCATATSASSRGAARPAQRRLVAGRQAVERLEERGAGPPERAAARCSSCYVEGMHANEPVHTWEVP